MKKQRWDAISVISAGLILTIAVSVAFYIFLGVSAAGAKPGKENAKEKKRGKDTVVTSSEAGETSETPETEPLPETSEETSPETASRDEDAQISALSQGEVDTISLTYDMTPRGFGVEGERDTANRPVYVNDFMTLFEGTDANVVCYCSDENTKKVAFTFQAGMETGYTESVLDILKDYNVKSTFYISHYYAAKNPSTVKRMIAENHEIGSHSYTCPDDGIATLALEDQMADAMNLQNYVQQAFDYKMTKYNFNSSIWSPASVILMSEMGYEVCFFSSNYADFDVEAQFDVDETLKNLEDSLHPGCVYCFHMTNEITVKILPALIEYCKDQGYSIVQLN